MEEVYTRLAKRLDSLPNGYPQTDSGVELRILKKIFSTDEAEMALKLSPIPETAEAIAGRIGMALTELEPVLDNMVRKGQILSSKMYGHQIYMLVPFIVGIWEFQLNRMDKELSDLIEEYAPQLMPALGGYAPAITRVIPINTQVEGKHEVFRYEDIKQTLNKAKAFQVMECICSKERALQGHTCKHETERCLAFSIHEGAFDKYGTGRKITKEEALDIVARAEKDGLVHTSFNVQAGQVYLCNCCSCCCGILIGMKRFNAPYLLAKSNFIAQIDIETCAVCGVCADERCPMQAIVAQEDNYVVLPDRCIGCGVCTNTCPVNAITLVRKPDDQRDEPPQNMLEWYSDRAASRGIKITV